MAKWIITLSLLGIAVTGAMSMTALHLTAEPKPQADVQAHIDARLRELLQKMNTESLAVRSE